MSPQQVSAEEMWTEYLQVKEIQEQCDAIDRQIANVDYWRHVSIAVLASIQCMWTLLYIASVVVFWLLTFATPSADGIDLGFGTTSGKGYDFFQSNFADDVRSMFEHQITTNNAGVLVFTICYSMIYFSVSICCCYLTVVEVQERGIDITFVTFFSCKNAKF